VHEGRAERQIPQPNGDRITHCSAGKHCEAQDATGAAESEAEPGFHAEPGQRTDVADEISGDGHLLARLDGAIGIGKIGR
jgi:hypothetical protein